MMIPGWVVSLMTFPGVVFHEMAHKLFCDINNVEVFEVSYFTILDDKRSGYVVYKRAKTIFQAFSIAIAPLIFNSLICMILMFPMKMAYFFYIKDIGFSSIYIGYPCYIAGWVGISAGIHALPSTTDVQTLSEFAQSELTKFIIYLLQKFIYIASLPVFNLIFSIMYVGFISSILPRLFLSLGFFS